MRERDVWVRLMGETLQEMRVAAPARRALEEFFQKAATYLTNGEEQPVTGTLAKNWDRQLALEHAVAAVRAGDAPVPLEGDPADTVALAALAIRRGSGREYVTAHPELARASYGPNRTLLHDAAGMGDAAMVRLLLDLGADPNGVGEHTPLYWVGNACMAESGGEMVRLLAAAGADVNRQEGPKRATALHMAARRNHVHVAAALLDCGADLELRDSKGETALRRAVNCAKVEVAALLAARGADRHSKGSRGLTPLQAARTEAMKQALREPVSSSSSRTPNGSDQKPARRTRASSRSR
jgi:hypothetical protein